VSAQFSIRNLKIKPGLVLAPMSGVTTSAFRRLVKQFNPGAVGLVITEFISVEGLSRQGSRSISMMRFRDEERPFGVQIFGHDIDRMRDAALMVEEAGADLVDINCGCPAPKVVRRGGGCELMRQPLHLAALFRAVRATVKIPLTMKMRSGWDDSCKNAPQIAKMVESEGVEAITVHGRTRAQLYRGKADWKIAQIIKESVKIPVCGSGDVVCLESARERQAYGVDGLYIGRGALFNPLCFTEIATGQKQNLSHDGVKQCDILLRYSEMLLEDFPAIACIGKLKQLASQMCRGLSLRKAVCQAQTLPEILEIIRRTREQYATEGTIVEGPSRGAAEIEAINGVANSYEKQDSWDRKLSAGDVT
jgi:tRNA-dihydrouridine synthase B